MEKTILLIILVLTFKLDVQCRVSLTKYKLKHNIASPNLTETVDMKENHHLGKKNAIFMKKQNSIRIISDQVKLKSIAYRLLVLYGK